MSRYMKTAAEANEVALKLLEMVYDGDASDEQNNYMAAITAELIARLINLGIRCSPRGVQHTVRLNAVRWACKGLPVKVGMVEKQDPKTGKTYHALTTCPIGNTTPTVEGADNEEGE